MKTSNINKKLTLNKMTITVLRNPETVKGGNGDIKNDTNTVRTTTVTTLTTITDPGAGL